MSLYKITVLTVIAIISLCCANTTQVRPCNNGPLPTRVNIHGCTTPPCQLVTGTDALMDLTFTNPRFSNIIAPNVRATVDGVTVIYPLPSNGCPSLTNANCPINAGQVLDYRFRMPIFNYPYVNVDLEFWLSGDNREMITCFKVAARVVPPRV